MSENSENAKSSIPELVVWTICAPVLAVWALVSFLPIVSVIGAWGDVVGVLVALAFLATGAVGLIAAAVGYRWLLRDPSSTPLATSATRTMRIAALSAYAVVWMALYAI